MVAELESRMASGESWPQWLSVALSALGGAAASGMAFIRWMWNLSDRVLSLEQKMGERSVAEQLRADRHDNVYPMMTDKVIKPLEDLEDKVTEQGQKIAVLIDREQRK